MKYAIRSVKYFFALCVLCLAIITLNLAAGWSALNFSETVYVMFHTTRGLLMPAVIVLLAVFYPLFGFVTRRVGGDVAKHRTQLVNAMLSAGFSLESEADGVMKFRARGFLHKLMLLWEDEITVSQEGDRIVLSGIRRGVVRVVYRLESYIQMVEND